MCRELDDIRRRIRNILDQYPAAAWDLHEAKLVLGALSEIVRGRQSASDVVERGA